MKKRSVLANLIGVSVFGILVFLYDFYVVNNPVNEVLIKTVISMAVMYLAFHFFMRPKAEKP